MSTPAEPATRSAEGRSGAQWAERHPPIDGSGDPQAIEHSIDQTRDRLRHILEALQSKLSPAQILDRGLHYLKDNGAELAGGLGQRIKRNPMPVVFTAAGIGLLVAIAGRARRRRRRMSAQSARIH